MKTEMLDEAFDKTAWHGPTLLESVRGVSQGLASWRPGPRRHNIWELVVHAAYWKHQAANRLIGQPGHVADSFPFAGQNFFERPKGPRTFKEDVGLLVQEHRRLRGVVRRLPERAASRVVDPRGHRADFTIRGIAAHDLYHAGQIQLLRRLARAGK